MKRCKGTLALLLAGLMLLAGCTAAPQGSSSVVAAVDEITPARAEELHGLALQLLEYVQAGDVDSAMPMMEKSMQDASKEVFSSIWTSWEGAYGSYKGVDGYTAYMIDTSEIVDIKMEFAAGYMTYRTAFTWDGLVQGLFLQPYEGGDTPAASAAPTGVREVDVTVDAGEGYPLDGILALPAEGEPVAAVVLVHGSGPNDKNSTTGANLPFRDIAYSLAEQGIAVLRYDKRTYTYGAQLSTGEGAEKFTILEETVNDAVAAVELLQRRSDIPLDKIFVLGHSMGGGLAAYIGEQSGGAVAGYISAAGTTRPIWALQAEQTLLVADELEAAGDAETAEALRGAVEVELQNAAGMTALSDEALLETEVFGLPGWYMRSFTVFDTAALHLADGKPVLILQGGADRQVTETDYALWQQALAAHPDATFKLYPALNHLLGEYTGEEVPFADLVSVEYAAETPVDETLLQDLADWILAH